jgi:hypothetical protein
MAHAYLAGILSLHHNEAISVNGFVDFEELAVDARGHRVFPKIENHCNPCCLPDRPPLSRLK